MNNGTTVLLYTHNPAFFERRDTWFNRRGVDVFCAMDLEDAACIFTKRKVDLMLCEGPPGNVPEAAVREVVPRGVPIFVLADDSDNAELLNSYHKAIDSKVIRAPYGDAVLRLTAQALTVAVRHYIRILVQIQAGTSERSNTFGFSTNVSASGMLLETKRRLRIGDTIGVSFMLPCAPQMTACDALVVREAPSEGNTLRFGIKFIGLSVSDQEFIMSLASQSEQRAQAVGGRTK